MQLKAACCSLTSLLLRAADRWSYLHINDALQSSGFGLVGLVPPVELLGGDPVKISLAAHHR